MTHNAPPMSPTRAYRVLVGRSVDRSYSSLDTEFKSSLPIIPNTLNTSFWAWLRICFLNSKERDCLISLFCPLKHSHTLLSSISRLVWKWSLTLFITSLRQSINRSLTLFNFGFASSGSLTESIVLVESHFILAYLKAVRKRDLSWVGFSSLCPSPEVSPIVKLPFWTSTNSPLLASVRTARDKTQSVKSTVFFIPHLHEWGSALEVARQDQGNMQHLVQCAHILI